MLKLKEGLLVSIEGIDGSGKSTLAKNLYNLFHNQQYDALLTKEPGDSSLGKKIRDILTQNNDYSMCAKAEFLLFAADRAQHFEDIIIPALNDKKLVISDRLADSSLAYQGYGKQLDIKQLQTINTWAMNNIQPQVTIYVKISVEEALNRVIKRNAIITSFEKKEFLEMVAHGFEELYKNRNDVIMVEGTDSAHSLAQNSFSILKTWIHKNNHIL